MRRSWALEALEVEDLAEAVSEGSRAAVITHRNADPDSMASALIMSEVLARLGAEVCLALPEGPSRTVKDAIRELGIEVPASCRSDRRADVAVAVDSANPQQLGEYLRLYLTASTRIVLDHHREGSLADSAHIRLVDPEAPSATEIAVGIALKLGVKLKPNLATLGMLGIVYDTRRFASARAETFAAMAALAEMGGDYSWVTGFMRTSISQSSEDLSLRIAKLKAFSRLRLLRACNDILVAVTHIGSHESAIARSLVSEGADVAVVTVERREGFRVSIRVSQRAVEAGVTAGRVAKFIAEKLGGEGGGHELAGMTHLPPSAADSHDELADRIAESLQGKIGRWCVEARRTANPK